MENEETNIGPVSSDEKINGTIIWNKKEAQQRRFFLKINS